MKKKPEMIIMMGLPACGKNTWILKNKKSHIVVELDWIRKEIFGHQYHLNSEPYILATAKSMVLLLLSQNKDIIINATNLVAQFRNEWVNMAKKYDYNTKVVFLDTHWKKCYARNNKRKGDKVPDEVIERMGLILQRPTVTLDKADKIVIVKD